MNRSEAWAMFAAHADSLNRADELLRAFDQRFGTNPNPRFVVDGRESLDYDAPMLGDGRWPPYQLFHTPSQSYLPTEFGNRELAQEAADWLNANI